MSTSGPLIAIVGSTRLRDNSGGYRQGAESEAHAARVATACAELGAELSVAGCRLLVYSVEEAFIEAPIVKAYCATAPTKAAGSIVYRHPQSYQKQFTEQKDAATEKMFTERLDLEQGWEASFYRSLQDSDGVVLLGGGPSTLIAGHVAQALHKATMPINCFEGAAAQLSQHVKDAPLPPTEEELQATLAWRRDSARRIVASLVRRYAERQSTSDAERKRVDALEYRVQKLSVQASLAATEKGTAMRLASSVFIAILMGVFWRWSHASDFSVVPFLALLASIGASGGLLQLLRAPGSSSAVKAVGLGGSAGILFGLLYLIPQLAGTASGLGPTNSLQAALTLIVTFGAGMAADAVLDAFQKKSVDRAPALVDEALHTQVPKTSTQI